MSLDSGFYSETTVDLAAVLQCLWEKQLLTDVEFKVGNGNTFKNVRAHKMMLAMWSPVFSDIFFKGNSVSVVILKEANPSAFEAMLRYMYGLDPNLNRSPVKFVCEIHKLAVTYEIEALKSKCKTIICSAEVRKQNVYDLLEAAEYVGNESLKARCLKIIEDDTSGILKSYDSSRISRSIVYVILHAKRLSLSSEYELIEWVLKWAKKEYESSDTYSNIKEVVEEFLPLLNVIALTCEEFASLVKSFENVFNVSEGLCIFMNIAKPGSWPMPSWYNPDKIVERDYRKKSSRNYH